MELPRVDPVGVLELPEGFRSSGRARPRGARVLAALIASVFALVATATTVLTLGRYCITSQAGQPAPLRVGGDSH